MKKRSKRYLTNQAKIEKDKNYSIQEAVSILKESQTKFDQGVEIHIRLGIDAKKSDQLVRSIVELPHGSGKTKKIIAFVSPDQEKVAKDAGADIIGNDEVISQIKLTKKINFDVAVATPQMMKKIGPIAKILGQKGLMPNPKTETIGPDINKIIQGVKGGKIAFKNDDAGIVHALVGKLSFEDSKIVENTEAFIQAVKKAKPSGSKGTYFKTAYICSSMGPSVKLSLS